MKSFFYRQAISLVLALVDEAIKNPKARATWRDSLIQIADQINLLFPDRLG